MSQSEYVGSAPAPAGERDEPLKVAMRQARIEAADRTAVVVDLHDAELARLEILNEALTPLFASLPPGIEMFERGVTRGEPARLWVDMIAHVVMGRDKRTYRFVQDTRYGRRVLSESTEANETVRAVTQYVARRMIERERALAGDTTPLTREVEAGRGARRKRRRRGVGLFVLGVLFGSVAAIGGLIAAVLFFYPAG